MRYLFILFVLLGTLSTVSAQIAPDKEETAFTEAEQMPMFIADCPEGMSYSTCSKKAMLTYVYGNIKYPKKARKAKIEGMVVVSFIVEKDGTITNPSIYRDIGGGAGEEVLRVVEAMNDNGPSWTPGTIDDKPVRVEFKLPVKFKLSSKS